MSTQARSTLSFALPLALLGLLSFSANCWATTYYVSIGSGSDSYSAAQAQSKSTPWAHAPGMSCAAGIPSKFTPAPGDSIIVKGGETYGNSCFMWSLPGGSTGNPVYIGVDQTWYAGSAWARPVLTAGGQVIPNNYDTMFKVAGNVTFDNFEVTGFYWNAASCNGAPYGECGIFSAGQTSGQTFENLYIHGWTHAGTDAATSSGVIIVFAFGGWYNPVVHDCVIVGTDVPGDHSVAVFFDGPSVAYNNYIKQVASGFISSFSSSIHDNHIEDIGPAYCNMPFPANAGHCAHENGFEDNGDIGLDFYNNVITNVSGGLALWIAPNPGYTARMWNNVIYGVHDNQVLDMAPPVYSSTYCKSGMTSNNYCTTAGSYVFENNTVECGDDTKQYDQCQAGIGVIGSGATASSFLYQNNHFIAASTNSGCSEGEGAAANCTFSSSNVVQTLSQARLQGYTSSELYPFSPMTPNTATVLAGINLTSSISPDLASLANDSTFACKLGTANQPTCPGRVTKGRPSTGAWDAGAYVFSRPNPPTGPSANITTTQ